MYALYRKYQDFLTRICQLCPNIWFKKGKYLNPAQSSPVIVCNPKDAKIFHLKVLDGGNPQKKKKKIENPAIRYLIKNGPVSIPIK